jgi:hypothetical protein
MKSIRTASLFTIFLSLAAAAQAQQRERVVADRPVEATFKAPTLIQWSSTKAFDANTLNFAIKHSFGTIDGGYYDLWGMDGGANIRFGLDYGISNKWSAGFGRSSQLKVYDFRTKYTIIEQMRSGKIPVTVAYQGVAGINTSKNAFSSDYTNTDRLNFSHALLVSRKFNESFSAQLSPAVIHFNMVQPGYENTLVALGLAGRAKINRRTSLVAEFTPVLVGKSDQVANSYSIGLEVETGGHVFQMFLTTSNGLTEQYAIAQNPVLPDDNNPLKVLRLGFNIHRIFWFAE